MSDPGEPEPVPMRLVLDTNVLVSALLKPGSVPDLALQAIWARGAQIFYDDRIVAEYREVLARPKFRAIDTALRDRMISRVLSAGARLTQVGAWEGELPDENDRAFVEVALMGGCDAIITGNVKDFPDTLGFEVSRPADVSALLAHGRRASVAAR